MGIFSSVMTYFKIFTAIGFRICFGKFNFKNQNHTGKRLASMIPDFP